MGSAIDSETGTGTGGIGETFVVRVVRAEEWAAAKELRLAALRDPIAHLAFLERYEVAAERPDAFWQERTAGAAEGSRRARQIIAEAPDGEWAGTLTVLVEEAGTTDWAGFPVEHRQGHVVGVFVRPEYRGRGLTERIFDAALAWSWETGLERVRLIVHEDNERAQGLYRKVGFAPSGVVVPLEGREDERELEFVFERGA
ncbi:MULTISPECIES: GNAT family N-acetyltransferase [unclassified Streptomyces]|uniref:GNAT family N-acetyltransferase n=1 Tax=unclassified Streptomyces TaxID=2593676 RepID=UPI00093C70C6|nr:GNAT family N-acetyltransferase [Streptomyces sp. TSRI0107]OKJ84186.1 acetyltransferase [Streptomyces sp. TSRI0107]